MNACTILAYLKEIASVTDPVESNVKRSLFLFATLTANFVLYAPTVLAATLELSGSVREVPFFSEITRDPVLLKHKILDELSAESTLEQWHKKRSALKKAKNRVNLLSEMLDDSVRLVYYLEDLGMGRVTVHTKKFPISLQKARLNVARYARELARNKSASLGLRSRAVFHGNVADYMNGRYQKSRINELRGLKHLNGYLSRRRNFIVAYHDLRNGNRVQSDAAIRKMTQMTGSFPTLASVSMRLIIGRYYAGISSSGRKFNAASKVYRKYLRAALERMRRAPEVEQNQVLQFAALIWQKAEGRSINWSKPPYDVRSFPSSPITLAITERSAAQERRRGRYAQAADKYERLASAFEGSKTTRVFDDLVLATHEADYRRSKDSRTYEKSLVAKIAKYSDPAVMGEAGDSGSVRKFYESKLKRLVQLEITAAKKTKASRQQRQRAVAMAQGMFAQAKAIETKEHYATEIGLIHQNHGEHEKAVAQFMDMALNGRETSKPRFYALAIKSQSSLANWPLVTPWQGFKKGDGAKRQELARLYAELSVFRKNDWRIVGQIGLLSIATGDKNKAIETLTVAIETLPVTKDSGYASGFLLDEHKRSANWSALEIVARTALKKKITPVNITRRLDVHAYLALALLEGGKALLAGGDAKTAAAKLGEFTETYRSHKRHDDGFYHYATALYKSGKHMAGIENMQKFVESYPRSEFHKPALYIGGQWSLATASEEQVIYFYGAYVKQYNDSDKAQEVRLDLLSIYEGKLLYRQASEVYLRMTQDRNLDPDLKKSADLERLRIEMQHNSPDASVVMAKSLEKKYPRDLEIKMIALGAQAILASSSGQSEEVSKLEAKMSAIPSPGIQAQEMLGKVRYLKASMIAKGIQGEVVAISLRDPLVEMEKKYKAFIAAKKQYDSVCEGLQSSYCAGAMFDLSRMSEEWVKAFEDYQIADTLAKAEVDTFYKRKGEIIKTLTQVSVNADSRALELAASGESQPSHVRQILWFNSADWNFEGSDTENGHGFVQWKTAE